MSGEFAKFMAEAERLHPDDFANARAADIHSCHDGCTRAGCVNGRLQEEAVNLRAERDNARADRDYLLEQVAELRETIAESLRLLGTEPQSARAVLLDAARKGAA